MVADVLELLHARGGQAGREAAVTWTGKNYAHPKATIESLGKSASVNPVTLHMVALPAFFESRKRLLSGIVDGGVYGRERFAVADWRKVVVNRKTRDGEDFQWLHLAPWAANALKEAAAAGPKGNPDADEL
jgi:hypothetical protein